MKKKKIIITLAILVIIVLAFVSIKLLSKKKETAQFELEEIKRGDLENIVSCTGTLGAVSTVNVGSQVSGIVVKVFVDFNDNVKKGQVLAVLDKTMFKASVRDAESSVSRAKAQYTQAAAELKRNQPLFEKGYLSETEFLVTKTNAETAAASLKSAESSLERAKTQLGYTEITSPIDGTIIERTVDAGNTIAASFQAPKLFIIAEDLTQMRIEASVDESDIGQILENQSVRFTVQAYPEESFTGKVRQIRLSPKTVQDVVNYTVMVDAPNEYKKLLPGMTATVDFLIEEKKDVLLVPNSALSFTPSTEVLQKAMENLKAQMEKRRAERNPEGGPRNGEQNSSGESRRQGGGIMGGGGGMMSGMMSNGKMPGNFGRVFILDENGVPAIAMFEKGSTDGKHTEIKRSRQLKEGMKVIISAGSTTKNQQTGMPMMMPFGRPMGGGGRH